MRLWTVHPRYLDTQGLLAAWREGLLAQKVLQGGTKGYRNHPQLTRFKATSDPAGALGVYLRGLHREATGRGYRFDESKIAPTAFDETVPCTRGQLLYEWNHLKGKLKERDAARLERLAAISEPEPHPLFRIVEGEIESWEITKAPL